MAHLLKFLGSKIYKSYRHLLLVLVDRDSGSDNELPEVLLLKETI